MKLGPRSVRTRLALWYAGTLALLLLACAAGVYAWTRHSRLTELDHDLNEGFELIAEDVVTMEPDGGAQLRNLASESVLEDTLPWFELYAADGRRLLRQPPDVTLDLLAPGELAARADRGPESVRLAGDRRVRREVRRARIGDADVIIASGRSEARMRRELAELSRLLAIAIPAAVLLAGFGGWLLARRALEPVGAIAARAREITAERLSERLPVENPEDELGRLAATCNEMIARLERSFAQLRRFTADASHELRTPLTTLRSVGEMGLREARDVAGHRELLGSMLEEIDRMSRLLDSLLMLSRADGGSLKLALEPADLAGIAREAADLAGVLAEEKEQSISMEIDGALPVRADRVLLRHAIVNLVDNAIRHGPRGQPIRVVGRARDGFAVLEVIDRGDGIAPEHHEQIFERFYRVDEGRARESGGAGLGLAIARFTVEAHGGRIELESARGRGATFRVVLPRDPGATRTA